MSVPLIVLVFLINSLDLAVVDGAENGGPRIIRGVLRSKQ